eukprot:TRINITY_DN9841_c0_g1_i1.p1 TRINITY_DN9841_c0_g1~~TRINITY_DN9841_c0_g1_i1.p1  ORF type:complete len:115 (-),score=12.10 TRINITY_DN9841_c0_g1_i1:38-382(-)
MGRLFLNYLSGDRIYSCKYCDSHLANRDDIISKAFQGRYGKASLFRTCINVTSGNVEERTLRTGLHKVADIYCVNCQELLGWKYEFAFEITEKYKEGKYILEKAKIKRDKLWKD